MTWEYLEVKVKFLVARDGHKCTVLENSETVEEADWVKSPKKHRYWDNSHACANHYAGKGWELMKMDKEGNDSWYFFKRQG
jgi:hypothetical protein